MTNDFIAQVIRRGIIEADGFRYVCHDWEIDNGKSIEHEIVRIKLADLDRQYEEGRTGDEITGWEKVSTVIETF